jgi:hypothetical protein
MPSGLKGSQPLKPSKNSSGEAKIPKNGKTSPMLIISANEVNTINASNPQS